MRSFVSMALGLITGWLVLTQPAMIPDTLKKIIGEQVAHGLYFDQIIDFMHLSPDAAYYMRFWVIMLLVGIIPLSLYALAATAVYLWGGKGRVVFYSCLCIPVLNMVSIMVMYNISGHISYFRGSVRYFDIGVFNIIIFSVLFLIFAVAARKYKLVRSA